VKIGVCLPNYGPAAAPGAIKRAALAAEEMGYDSIWATDHILAPEKHGATFGQVIEALITLGYLAGITERVTLATSILVLPQRDPILAAKQVAAIDQLANGRLILGVGVGWMAEEFAYLRTDFHQRGRLMDEWLAVMKTLWREERPSFQGEWIQFAETMFEPKPIQPGGPPIHIGGGSEAALRRAAQFDGWHPTGMALQPFAEGVIRLRELAGERADQLSVSLRAVISLDENEPEDDGRRARITGSATAVSDKINAYREVGLDHLVCYFQHENEAELLRQMEKFSGLVKPSFAVGRLP
jgi:probable F420-dependent oxidoreductase